MVRAEGELMTVLIKMSRLHGLNCDSDSVERINDEIEQIEQESNISQKRAQACIAPEAVLDFNIDII
mgnify:CR=1 FL=1